MAFGFSPKHISEFKIKDQSIKQALVTAHRAANTLGWKIGPVTDTGFTAYTNFSMTSWSEEIQIKVIDDKIWIKSECTGSQLMDWGKNKKNIEKFVNSYNKLSEVVDEELANTHYAELENAFVDKEDKAHHSPLQEKEKDGNFLSLFVPREGYFITPILVNLNILIFILMVVTGVNALLPDTESLLKWGANFRPSTLDGQWWRLLTSCFLHIGILHLLMNMYALLYIGLLLEPIMGRARYLSAYLLTGIAGSAASLYWNELTVSAGASGAIFGMYGVFLAMLTTNLIEKTARRTLLTSIGIFVGYNLLNGMKGGIDNAAHIGGLVSGIIVGFASYPSLIKPSLKQLKTGTIAGLSVLILGAALIVLLMVKPSDINKFNENVAKFGELETQALSLYQMPDYTTDEDFLYEIENNGIPAWKECLEIVEDMENYNLPAAYQERVRLLKEYAILRRDCYETMYDAISNNTIDYQEELDQFNVEIQNVINELSNL